MPTRKDTEWHVSVCGLNVASNAVNPLLQKVEDFSFDSYQNREGAAENVKRMRGTGLEAWIMDRKRKG